MKKAKTAAKAIVNRRAGYDYALGEPLTAGLVLNGLEVRAARDGMVSLKGSFITFREGEMWLNNASFSLKLNEKGGASKTVDTEPRKLLITARQRDDFSKAKQAGYSFVPLRLMTGGRFIKLVMTTGKGKKKYDKRQTIKERDLARHG